MSTLTTTLTAAVLALSLSGLAFAADQPPAESKPGAQQGQTSTQPTERDRDYLAALKKCETLTGADKQTCIDLAKKKYDQM